ncbi:secondary thiamine-phosphate synthase enzyme YjbQ [Candidatus Woesearchaeota archaeon]|nr:secondary thiamine-phosphate synthase enzyme YjbQ [Candidatus Woesearchaeota archaeon]MBW3013902.1 secondary thiamine-phosphate synthase enzyme YjbQ [Candidatus Woesearchaeota archaeon]
METITVSSNKKQELIDITSDVKRVVDTHNIREGVCCIYTGHATGAIMINENHDPAVCDDILNCLEKLIPSGKWKHDQVDNNAAAHIKASIIGPSQIIPIKNGELMLGTWQAIMFADLDGPRQRKVIIKVIEG